MIEAEELYKLFCGMSETMQVAIIEIMKVTQNKQEEEK
jgi:hypothetical protein